MIWDFYDLYRLGLQAATNMYGAVLNGNMLFLTKHNIFNHDIFNSAYAQYYSYTELVFFFNGCVIS